MRRFHNEELKLTLGTTTNTSKTFKQKGKNVKHLKKKNLKHLKMCQHSKVFRNIKKPDQTKKDKSNKELTIHSKADQELGPAQPHLFWSLPTSMPFVKKIGQVGGQLVDLLYQYSMYTPSIFNEVVIFYDIFHNIFNKLDMSCV